jgi:hypothetical protein
VASLADVNLYSVYGSCLATAEEFPELRRVPSGAPKWTFEAAVAIEPMRDAAELGAERIYNDVHARLFRHADGHRITVDDTGSFDLSADGRTIRWENRSDAWPDFVRAHLIGRVLATAMYLDGWLPLHGSAVAFDEGVIAFLAPKGFGKSSLAYALLAHGGRLVTDDTLAVELSSPPRAWPGVHSMRVRTDSLTALGQTHDGAVTREGKALLTNVDEARLSHEPAPLRALYLLNPARADDSSRPVRTRMPSVIAAVAAVGHVKVAGMLGSSAARPLLDRCVSVVNAAPVYRLTIPRNLAGLSEAAAHIAGWHAGGGLAQDG